MSGEGINLTFHDYSHVIEIVYTHQCCLLLERTSIFTEIIAHQAYSELLQPLTFIN